MARLASYGAARAQIGKVVLFCTSRIGVTAALACEQRAWQSFACSCHAMTISQMDAVSLILVVMSARA